MTELKVHQCLISYGNLPILLVLKELEENEEYEKCAFIKNSIENYNLKFEGIANLETKYSKKTESKYYEQFKELTQTEGETAKSNMEYYVREVKHKLEL